MKCEQIQDLLSLYVDNILDEEENRKVAEHLQECIECQRILQELTEMLNMFSNIETIEPPEDFKNNVMGKIKEEKPAKAKFRKSWMTLAATAAIVIIMIGSIGISNINDQKLSTDSTRKEKIIVNEIAILSTPADDADMEIAANELSQKEISQDEPPLMNFRRSMERETALGDEVEDATSASIENKEGTDNGNVGIMSISEPQSITEEVERVEMVLKSEELNSTKTKIIDIIGENHYVFEANEGLIIVGWENKSEAQTDYLEELRNLAKVEKEIVTVNNINDELDRLITKEEELDVSIEEIPESEKERQNEVIKWEIDILSNTQIDNILFYEIYIIKEN